MKRHTFKRSLSCFLVFCLLLTAAPLAGFVAILPSNAAVKRTYKTGDIIAFGEYPQSKVVDKNTESALNSIDKSWKSYRYYSGTGYEGSWFNGMMTSGDWMRYADITFQGAKYRAVTFDQYRPTITGNTTSNSSSAVYTIQHKYGYYCNEVYYFKYEPLKWKILDPNKGFVFCESIIDAQAFQNTVYNDSVLAEWGIGTYWQDDTEKIYANNYAKSSIRSWLAKDFYDIAFSSEEKAQIKKTAIDNKAWSASDSRFNCEQTTDRIFLLSYQDMTNPSYGFNKEGTYDLARIPTAVSDYAKCQGVKIFDFDDDAWWWLRSPGSDSVSATGASGGTVYWEGPTDGYVNGINGIRPAFCFKDGIIDEGPAGGATDEPITKTITYTYDKGDKPEKDKKTSMDVTFDSNWFNSTSEHYQHGLAQFCSQFVTIGYARKNQVKAALEAFEFTVRDEDINLSTGRDQVNYFIAKKDVPTNEGTKTLVFCGFIGSHKLQWNSNFDPYGTERSKDSKAEDLGKSKQRTIHLGFEDAKTFVMNRLATYLKENKISGEQAKFLVTGHSRGAATANLVAADLIRGTFGVTPDDIYAYTFATPNNVKTTAIQDFDNDVFDRIFNIVNPQDFVTHVLPNDWGYYKYGTTYYLPTRDNVGLSQYNTYKSNMLKYFSKVLPGTKFADYEKGEVTTYNIVKSFTDNVNNLDEFYKKDLPAFLEKKYVVNGMVEGYAYETAYKKPFEYFQDVLCPFVNKSGAKAEAVAISQVAKIETYNFGLYADFTTYFIQNSAIFKNFDHSHMAETYCSYMMTTEARDIQKPKGVCLYQAHCPVDIEIYDKETGELLGRTVNNVVDEEIAAGENAVVIEVEGDEKSFMLPDSISYEIKYIPYDKGKMDLTVASIGDELTETERVNFYDLTLTPGVVYNSVSESDAALSNYVLTTSGDKEIKPDQVLSAEETKQFTVTVRNENGEEPTETKLYVTEGDYVTITPIIPEGTLFAGWYDGETLVSTEEAYRFRPTGDITLTAKYKTAQLPGDVSGDGEVTAEDARLALRAAVGLETYEKGSAEFLAADASHDGAITSEDARLILRAAVGLETLT